MNEFEISILEQLKDKPTIVNDLDTIEEACWLLDSLDKAIEALRAQPKRGEWIRADGDTDYTLWKCDQCGCVIYSEIEHDRKKFHTWCGMCGAKMDADMRESEDAE